MVRKGGAGQEGTSFYCLSGGSFLDMAFVSGPWTEAIKI